MTIFGSGVADSGSNPWWWPRVPGNPSMPKPMFPIILNPPPVPVIPVVPPVAQFEYRIYNGLQVKFTGKWLNYVTSVLWDFGDGTTSGEREPLHRYSAPGNYVVTFTTYNSETSNFATQAIYVSEVGKKADFTYSAAGQTVKFSETCTVINPFVQWDFGDGGTSEESDPVHVYAEPGNYTVTLALPRAGLTVAKTIAVAENPPGNIFDTYNTSFDLQPVSDFILSPYRFESDGDYIYVPQIYSATYSSRIRVYEKGSYSLLTDFAIVPLGGIAIDNDYIYMADETSGTLRRYSKETGTLITSRSVTGASRIIDVACSSSRIYVLCDDGSKAFVRYFDIATFLGNGTLILDNLNLNAVAIEATDSKIFVAIFDGSPNYVQAYNLSGSLLQTISVHDQVWDLAITGEMLYVSGFSYVAPAYVNQNWHVEIFSTVDYSSQEQLLDIVQNNTDAYYPHLASDSDRMYLLKHTTQHRPAIDVYKSAAGAGGMMTSPMADFTANTTTGAAPLTVNFTDASTGGPESWLWEFGDGETAQTQNASHAFPAGIYTVRLTVSNALGSSSKEMTIVSYGSIDEDPGFWIKTENYYCIIDSANDRILRYNLNFEYVDYFGAHGTGNGQFNGATYLAWDGAYIYVADSNNHRIQKFNEAGAYQSQFATDGAPYGVATNGGALFVTVNHEVQIYSMAAVLISRFGSQGSEKGKFNTPKGIAVDANYIFIVDNGNDRIQVFTFSQEFVAQLGTEGGGDEQFNAPTDCRIDGLFLTVYDTGNDRLISIPISEGLIIPGIINETFVMMHSVHGA